MNSGSSEGQLKIHWFTKSDTVYLRKYACWKCGKLIFCDEHGKFECVFGRPLTEGVCAFRLVARCEIVHG